MIIDDSDGSANETSHIHKEGSKDEDITGKAYKESMTSADGFIRGQGGRLKFNKDTKKRRREDMDEDVEMADGENTGTGRKKKEEKKELGFGHEFKAKVCMALLKTLNDLFFKFLSREPEATSRSKEWTHMVISRCRMQLSERKAGNALESLQGGDGSIVTFNLT